jgi:hypothetical protein
MLDFLGDLLAEFFSGLVWVAIKSIGAFMRWIFLNRKYSFEEVYQQDWNGRIGLLAVLLLVIFLMAYHKVIF